MVTSWESLTGAEQVQLCHQQLVNLMIASCVRWPNIRQHWACLLCWSCQRNIFHYCVLFHTPFGRSMHHRPHIEWTRTRAWGEFSKCCDTNRCCYDLGLKRISNSAMSAKKSIGCCRGGCCCCCLCSSCFSFSLITCYSVKLFKIAY